MKRDVLRLRIRSRSSFTLALSLILLATGCSRGCLGTSPSEAELRRAHEEFLKARGTPAVQTKGDCLVAEALDGAFPVEHDVVLRMVASGSPPIPTGVYASTTSLSQLGGRGYVPPAEVRDLDFRQRQLLAGSVYRSNTCGLRLQSFTVSQPVGREAPHLDVTVVDPAGGCVSTCTALGFVTIAVAVRAGTKGTVCVRVLNECPDSTRHK